MSDANSKRHKIIEVLYPPRIARPDHQARTWIVISPIPDRIQVRRHWNKDSGVTEVCQCEPPCGTSREDYFTGALQHQGTSADGASLWEPVVLHLTEQTVRSIYLYIRMRQDEGDLQGLKITMQRQGGRANDRVTCRHVERGSITDSVRRIDVAAVVHTRLRITTQFFGKQLLDDDTVSPPSINADQVVTPARSRSTKPKVAKGKR